MKNNHKIFSQKQKPNEHELEDLPPCNLLLQKEISEYIEVLENYINIHYKHIDEVTFNTLLIIKNDLNGSILNKAPEELEGVFNNNDNIENSKALIRAHRKRISTLNDMQKGKEITQESFKHLLSLPVIQQLDKYNEIKNYPLVEVKKENKMGLTKNKN